MKLLVFGSLNIDTVLQVDHFVRAGETLQATQSQVFPGGKGLNQAIAIARAGSDVYMAGNIGSDGEPLLALMRENGVDSRYIRQTDGLTGAAYIQVDPSGQNCILIAKNATAQNSSTYIREVLDQFSSGDILLLQNEISCLDELIFQAHGKAMTIYLNPSPYNQNLQNCRLEWVSGFILNEIEGNQMTGQTDPHAILQAMHRQYSAADVVLTIGPKGSLFINSVEQIEQKTFEGEPIDTTAAGDTFTGYYLSCLNSGTDQKNALMLASKAASIAVTIPGATSSIPFMKTVLESTIQEMN
jgi:ribokinase